MESGIIETVAVKVLKDTATKEAEEDFMREVEIMASFQHSNILSLLGVVFKGTNPLIIYQNNPLLSPTAVSQVVHLSQRFDQKEFTQQNHSK